MKPNVSALLLAMAFAGLSLSACGERSQEPAPREPAPVDAAPPALPKVMMFEEAALFDVDKADLKPEGEEQLQAYREQARADLSRADRVRITGHTDNTGAADYNTQLSQQRAEAVRDYLISIGVDASKMEASGAGDTKPIADNTTTEGRAKNRRVEIEVTGLGK